MSATRESTIRCSDFPTRKAIFCVVPDDGTDKRLLAELRKKHGIVKAGSAIRRGIGALADIKTKRGKLPGPELVRVVFVMCDEDQADEVFDFIFWSAHIDEPGRGAMWQRAVTSCTPYELPADIADEEAGA